MALSSGLLSVKALYSDVVNDHSASLAPMINRVLEESKQRPSDLNAIAVSNGPGSYTGLRVGLSTAKAMCYALGCPLIPVDTLQSLALTTIAGFPEAPHNIYVSVLDARRQDAYMAVFDGSGTRLEDNRFMTVTPGCLDNLLDSGRDVYICGEGMDKWTHFSGLPCIHLIPVNCNALNLITSAVRDFRREKFADLGSIVPTYLKPPNITIPA